MLFLLSFTVSVPTWSQQVEEHGPALPIRYCWDAPTLGEWAGLTIREGGASGLARIPGSDREFWMITDRGPNIPADQHPLAAGRTIKLFPFPDYAQKLIRFRLEAGAMVLMDMQTIKNPEGRPLSGLPYPEGVASHQEWAWSDDVGSLLAPDSWGMDVEALVLQNDSLAWIADEYRPALFQVHLPTGRIVDALIPGKPSRSGLILPELLAYRQPNRGFEALAMTSDGVLFALLQSPLQFPDASTAPRHNRLNRLLRIDLANGKVETLVYPMNAPRGSVSSPKWKIGDMVARDEHTLVVLEHGSAGEDRFADLYQIDLRDASVLPQALSTPDQALEVLAHPDTLVARFGVLPLRKTHLLDLVAAGFDLRHAKPEGLALLNTRTAVVLQDNDYGLDSPEEDGQVRLTGVPTCVTLFEWSDSE